MMPSWHPLQIDFRNSVMQEENWVNWWIKPVGTVLVRFWVLLKKYQQEPFKLKKTCLVMLESAFPWFAEYAPIFGRPMIIQLLSNMKESHQRRFGSSSLQKKDVIVHRIAPCKHIMAGFWSSHLYWLSHVIRGYYLLDIVYRDYKDPATSSGYHVCIKLFYFYRTMSPIVQKVHISCIVQFAKALRLDWTS